MFPAEPNPTRWDLHWRMFGAEVRIRPIFWASCVLLGVIYYRDPEIGGMRIFGFWFVAVLTTMLAHHTGHILIARLFGTRVRVVLSGLGGQVHGLEERKRWERVAILSGGALGNLFICGILWIITDPKWSYFPAERFGPAWTNFLANGVQILFLLNAFWALLNELPLWPLDGGRIAVEIAEGLFGRRGQIAALVASLGACLLLSFTAIRWARHSLINRYDEHYPLYLLFFLIQSLYCYFFWLSTFRALWGDTEPFDDAAKSGRAA